MHTRPQKDGDCIINPHLHGTLANSDGEENKLFSQYSFQHTHLPHQTPQLAERFLEIPLMCAG